MFNLSHLFEFWCRIVGLKWFLLAFFEWERFKTIVKLIVDKLPVGALFHYLQGTPDRQFVLQTRTVSTHYVSSIGFHLISVVIAINVSKLRSRTVLWPLVISNLRLKTHQSLQFLLLLNLDLDLLLFENHLLNRKHILGLICEFLALVLRVVLLGIQCIFNEAKSFSLFLDF